MTPDAGPGSAGAAELDGLAQEAFSDCSLRELLRDSGSATRPAIVALVPLVAGNNPGNPEAFPSAFYVRKDAPGKGSAGFRGASVNNTEMDLPAR